MRERGNTLLKILDRYVGIPLVRILGLFTRKRFFGLHTIEPGDLRFLLLQTGAIGDTILLSAIVREIKHSFPRCSITLVVSKSNLPMAALLKNIERIVVFDMSHPFASLKAVKMLKNAHILLDFAAWARINSVIAYIAKADFKIGFKRKRMRRHYIFDLAVEHSDDVHELDNYRRLLRPVQCKIQGFLPLLHIEPQIASRVATQFSSKRPYIVLHPFPGGYKKQLKEWPLDNWIALGRDLINKEFNVFISGSKEDAAAAASIKQELDKCDPAGACTVLCGHFSLAEVAAILYKSSLLITVNTGIMHMGAALNVNMIALHGPTSPRRWGPSSNNAIIIKPTKECAPCISLGFEYGCKHGGCMQTIRREEVLQHADRILTSEKELP